MNKFFIALFILFNFVIKPVFAVQPLQLINKSERQVLTGLNMPVLLPSYIPPAFKLKKIEAVVEKTAGPGEGNKYMITFSKKLKDGKSVEFSITSTPGGIGDLMLVNPQPVKTKFGSTAIYIDPVMENSKTRLNNCIDMDWLRYANNFYRFSSGGGCSPNDNNEFILRVSREEAVKIISSLQVFR